MLEVLRRLLDADDVRVGPPQPATVAGAISTAARIGTL